MEMKIDNNTNTYFTRIRKSPFFHKFMFRCNARVLSINFLAKKAANGTEEPRVAERVAREGHWEIARESEAEREGEKKREG